MHSHKTEIYKSYADYFAPALAMIRNSAWTTQGGPARRSYQYSGRLAARRGASLRISADATSATTTETTVTNFVYRLWILNYAARHLRTFAAQNERDEGVGIEGGLWCPLSFQETRK